MSENQQENGAPRAKLNMAHGFVKSIIRNQVDRDKYDKKVKAEKSVVGKPKSSGPRPNKSNQNRSKKPDLQTYRPPTTRRSQGPRTLLFKFEYEDKNGCVHERDIYKDDDPYQISRALGSEIELTVPMTKALTDFLRRKMDDCQSEGDS